MFKLIPLTFQTGRNHESKLVHLSLKEYSLHVKTTIRIRNMLETYLGEKRKVMPIFLERVMDASRCKITRPREQNCGRLASSTKVSDISSMGATTRERGVLCHRQLAIIYFAVSRMKTSAPHTIDDVHRIGIADSTSYLIESIIAFERCSGKHAIGHAIGDKL